jgi:hypothetical protein
MFSSGDSHPTPRLGRTGDEVSPSPTFRETRTRRGRVVAVPSKLPTLPVARAFARVRLPLHLNWSEPDRTFDLRDRRQRACLHEIVLREGGPDDVLAYVDGALLLNLWDDLVLPLDVREAWAPIIEGAGLAADNGRTCRRS